MIKVAAMQGLRSGAWCAIIVAAVISAINFARNTGERTLAEGMLTLLGAALILGLIWGVARGVLAWLETSDR